MAIETADVQSTRSEEMPHDEGRLVSERSERRAQTGTIGVSDERRAELERMEAAAGVQHESEDESVPQQGDPDNLGDRLKPDFATGRLSQSAVNPEIDKH